MTLVVDSSALAVPFDRFRDLARAGGLVPVWRDVLLDTDTPVAAFAKLRRGPFGFLLEHWRPGAWGAVRMGVRHGIWCIGCCWALMASLFALGVMSIPWMAVIAAFIALEKLLPWRRTATTVVTVALLVLGLAVALVPDRVPGLMAPEDGKQEMTMPA